jgi:peroxiredoxin
MPWTVKLAPMLLGVLLLASGCARLGWFHRQDRSLGLSPPRVGKPAPEFDYEDFDGRRVKLSDQRGKVVALIFWRTKCMPCRAMIPHEREMVERLRDKPFVLISVNTDEDHDDARKVIAAERMTWTQLKTSGAADSINRRYGVEAVPAVYVIDQKGILRACGTHLRGADLERAVEVLLAGTASRAP